VTERRFYGWLQRSVFTLARSAGLIGKEGECLKREETPTQVAVADGIPREMIGHAKRREKGCTKERKY